MNRAVFDTNVVVSGFLSPSGPPGRIVEWLRNGCWMTGLVVLTVRCLTLRRGGGRKLHAQADQRFSRFLLIMRIAVMQEERILSQKFRLAHDLFFRR